MNKEVSLESFISSCDDMLIVQEGSGGEFLKAFGGELAKAFGFVVGIIGAHIAIAVVAGGIGVVATNNKKKTFQPLNQYKVRNVTFVETSYLKNIDSIIAQYKRDIEPAKNLMKRMSTNIDSITKAEFYKVFNDLKNRRKELKEMVEKEMISGKTESNLDTAKKILTEMSNITKEISKDYDKIYNLFDLNPDEETIGEKNQINIADIENFINVTVDYANIPLSGIKVKEKYSKKELREQKKNK